MEKGFYETHDSGPDPRRSLRSLDPRTALTIAGLFLFCCLLIFSVIEGVDYYRLLKTRAWIGYSQEELVEALGQPAEKLSDGQQVLFIYRWTYRKESELGTRVITWVKWFSVDEHGIIRDAGIGEKYRKTGSGYLHKPG